MKQCLVLGTIICHHEAMFGTWMNCMLYETMFVTRNDICHHEAMFGTWRNYMLDEAMFDT